MCGLWKALHLWTGGAPVEVAARSHGVVAGVDALGGAGAEPDVKLRPAKELEYGFEQRPCISRPALQANSNNVVIP
jgi:hypothetical protein